MIELVVLGI